LPADAAPQRKPIGQRDINTSAPCRIVEAAAEPLGGLQPGLHWRAAISQTTAEKGIETLTRADPARIAFERPAVPCSVGSGFDRGMSPRFPDMASVSDPCVGERLAAPATANFECGEAG